MCLRLHSSLRWAGIVLLQCLSSSQFRVVSISRSDFDSPRVICHYLPALPPSCWAPRSDLEAEPCGKPLLSTCVYPGSPCATCLLVRVKSRCECCRAKLCRARPIQSFAQQGSRRDFTQASRQVAHWEPGYTQVEGSGLPQGSASRSLRGAQQEGGNAGR